LTSRVSLQTLLSARPLFLAGHLATSNATAPGVEFASQPCLLVEEGSN